MFTKITTGVLAGAALVASAAPAEAQYRYRHHYRGGDRTALALGAGALGLAVGAAIGSSNRGYYGGRGGYYGRPYYGDSYYGGGGYYDGYYGRPYGYRDVRRCWTDRQWDDWAGRWRRVRVCR